MGAMRTDRTKVLIIGGGFGGLFCARRRADAPTWTSLCSTALPDICFQPLLYQCATGTPEHRAHQPVSREELSRHRNVRTLLGEAVRLDPDARSVTAMRPDETTFTVDYDILVLAAGMKRVLLRQRTFRRVGTGHEDPR